METNKPKEKQTLSVNLPSEVYNQFKEVYNSSSSTQPELFELMLKRYLEPIKQQESNAAELAELTAQVENYQRETEKLKQLLNDSEQERNALLSTLETERNDHNSERESTETDRQAAAVEVEQLKDKLNETFNLLQAAEQELHNLKASISESPEITIDPLNLKLLQYVADREGKRRNQDWTISDVINFFVHCRFEKGNLNGDLKSVPDKVVYDFKQELGLIQQVKNDIDI